MSPSADGILLTDGYSVYAQCGAHCRRKFFEVKYIEPEGSQETLEMIGLLYMVEATIREQELTGTDKRKVRQEQARPLVERSLPGSSANSSTRVAFQANARETIKGMLTRYNKKTVTVIADDGWQWNVSLEFLTKLEEPNVIENTLDNLLKIVPLKKK